MGIHSREIRVVLAIGDVGAGHRSAAVALAAALHERYPEQLSVHIENLFAVVDPSPFGDSNRGQRWVARSGASGALINNGFWYFENTPPGHAVMDLYMRLSLLRAYRRRLAALAPDLIVSLHPYVAQMVGHLVASGAPYRHAVVVTDLATLPRSWAVASAERVIYPTPAARQSLERYGVSPERLVGPLFPLAQALWSPPTGSDPLAELGLGNHGAAIVFTAGGNAMSSLAPAAIALAGDAAFRVVVVCGKDERLRLSLAAQLATQPNVRVLGFASNLIDLMAAADVVVTKPGPATILELELLKRRTLLVGDIGPQEHGNIAYALENPYFRHHRGTTASIVAAVAALSQAPTPIFHARRRRDETHTIAATLASLWSGGQP